MINTSVDLIMLTSLLNVILILQANVGTPGHIVVIILILFKFEAFNINLENGKTLFTMNKIINLIIGIYYNDYIKGVGSL